MCRSVVSANVGTRADTLPKGVGSADRATINMRPPDIIFGGNGTQAQKRYATVLGAM